MGEKQENLVELLEQEGDIAGDYLEELLDIADIPGNFTLDVIRDRASVVIEDDGAVKELEKIVGEDGQVLDALQELTRLAVQVKTGNRSRLMLDIAGFRAGKRRELEELAKEAVAKVRASGEPYQMDPMNAFERKVVHDEVLAMGMYSESFGSDPARYIQISPAE